MNYTSINWEGTILDIEFEYRPRIRASDVEPASEEEFDIVSVRLPSGSDALQYFNDEAIDYFITLIKGKRGES